MNESVVLAFAAGISAPVVLGFCYWVVVDQAKRYTDEQLREAKKELREYARDQR